jgi:hypothetical protein
MKAFLPVLLFFSIPSFGQSPPNESDQATDFTVVLDSKTWGYVNGIRLDSIDATYAEFRRHVGDGLYFDYGQKRNKRKELMLTDKNGKRLVFVPFTNSFFLNFFYANGWQMDKALTNSDGTADSFILVKKP